MTATSSPAEPPESTPPFTLIDTLHAVLFLHGFGNDSKRLSQARRIFLAVRSDTTAAHVAELEAALAAAEARLRAVEALLETWDTTVHDFNLQPTHRDYADDLRAALAAGG